MSDTLNEVVMPNVDPTYLEASYQNKLDLTLLDQQTTLQQLNAPINYAQPPGLPSVLLATIISRGKAMDLAIG
nr:hypothetical protein [Haliscomenobacter sp.]